MSEEMYPTVIAKRGQWACYECHGIKDTVMDFAKEECRREAHDLFQIGSEEGYD